MNKLAVTSLALGLALAAPSAFAQCPPGSWLCADITIGTAPPPPPTVVVQPAPPPVVVVRPAPRVYVAPPPVVVYQPQPVYVQQQQQYALPPPQRMGYMPRPYRTHWLGFQGSLGGATFGGGGLGGASLGLRFRNRGHFGGELSGGIFGGRDFNGDARAEVPLTGNLLFYANPQNAFQVYFLAGLGFSFANVSYDRRNVAAHGGRSGDKYSYFGGQLGIGGELQLSPRFSLFADVRAFLRGRIDESAASNPEFSRNVGGTTQTTNTSTGLLGQVGGILYF